MNLIIGLVILICLVCGEFHRDSPASDLPLRLILIAGTTMVVPALAIFQTLFVSRHRSLGNAGHQEEVINRLTACHSAVWLAASMAVILSLRWPEVVRINWGLEHYFLLDELLILAPVMLSLIASWAIFYDVENAWIVGEEASSREGQAKGAGAKRSIVQEKGSLIQDANRIFQWLFSVDRMQFVWLRIQFQILVFAIPVGMAVLLSDLRPYLQQWGYIEATLACVALAGGAFFVFPYAMRWVWQSDPIDVTWRSAVLEEFDERGLIFHELGRWQTGGRIVNACILGHRWDRRILVSDRLLADFPEREARAVVRHEAGHLGLRHTSTRIAFLLLPLAAVMLVGCLMAGTPLTVEYLSVRLGIEPVWGFAVFGILYVAYLLATMRWLSHRMEYEADLYAGCIVDRSADCKGGQANEMELRFSAALACDMSEALLRLAAYHLPQFEKATLFHPSIRSRIEALQRIEDGKLMTVRFSSEMKSRWRYAFLIFMTVGLIVAAAMGLIG